VSEIAVSLSPRASSRRVAPVRLLSDEALAGAASSGDERAFTEIYSRYHQGLYRYCRSILGSDSDAQDALQNVMASALGALVGESRDIALKPWLYRVAHNESISILRRRRGHADLDAIADVSEDAASAPEARERLRQLFGDLAALPDRQRSALVMRELTGLEYAEIAAACGISTAAATQAVYDARRGLQTLAEGRDMQCEDARRLASESDRRTLRSRKLKAHLRACAGCRDFQAALIERPRDLAALAPALPASAGVALLHGVLGGGASGGGGSAGGISGLVASAKTAGGSLLVKSAVATAVIGAGAGGVVEVRTHSGARPSSSASASGASHSAKAAPHSGRGVTVSGSAQTSSAAASRTKAPVDPASRGGHVRHSAPTSTGSGAPTAHSPATSSTGSTGSTGNAANASDHSHGNSSGGSSHANSSGGSSHGHSPNGHASTHAQGGSAHPTPSGQSSHSHATPATPATPATHATPGVRATPATPAAPATPPAASHSAAGSTPAADPGVHSNAPAIPPSRSGR
jgi:RNA polymerase sigma factor (sigma-70 family)